MHVYLLYPHVSFSLCVCLPAEANEEIVKVTYGELRCDVALFAAAMRKMGVQTGDRVVGESMSQVIVDLSLISPDLLLFIP